MQGIYRSAHDRRNVQLRIIQEMNVSTYESLLHFQMSSIKDFIDTFNERFQLYTSVGILVTGTLGNILNCLVFTRRSLCHNPCSMYFFAASITNLIAIYFSGIPRMLNGFGIYPAEPYLPLYCKVRTYMTYMNVTASTWFIVGALADRFASSSSSARIRSFSQMKVTRRVIVLMYAVVNLFFFEMLICFDGAVLGSNCYPKSDFCRLLTVGIQLITYSLLPPVSMLILGWLTVRHVRQSQNQRHTKNLIDRQLFRMLLIQVFCTALLTMPFSIQKVYLQITRSMPKTSEHVAIDTFFGSVIVFLTLANSSTPFYLFTLTSPMFRKELKLILCINRRLTQIHPQRAIQETH